MKHPKDWIHPKDLKYVLPKPDPDFSPERNQIVIENVIRETERNERRKKQEFNDQVDERVNAVTEYLKSVDRGGATSNIEKFFGKKQLAYLRGEHVANVLRDLSQKNKGSIKLGKKT